MIDLSLNVHVPLVAQAKGGQGDRDSWLHNNCRLRPFIFQRVRELTLQVQRYSAYSCRLECVRCHVGLLNTPHVTYNETQ